MGGTVTFITTLFGPRLRDISASFAIAEPSDTTDNTRPKNNNFFRANRQFIVSRKAVKDIAVWFGSRLALNLQIETPERIIISKARVPEFKRWLQ